MIEQIKKWFTRWFIADDKTDVHGGVFHTRPEPDTNRPENREVNDFSYVYNSGKHFCKFCHGETYDNTYGNCIACGAPREKTEIGYFDNTRSSSNCDDMESST